MPAPILPARIDWRDGTPCNAAGIPCAIDEQALQTARDIFIASSHLPARWQAQQGAFTLLETGFGNALNFLACREAWHKARATGWLHYVALESSPFRADDLRSLLAGCPAIQAGADALLAQYPALVPGFHRLVFAESRLTLTLLLGEPMQQLARLHARVDAWLLNHGTELAPDALQADMRRLSQPAASVVWGQDNDDNRRALSEAGCIWQSLPAGHTRFLTAQWPDTLTPAAPARPWLHREPCTASPTTAIVIGAGIAGASTAHALAQRGWQVTVVDAAQGPASGASGNPAAIIYPKLSPPAIADVHFQQQAFLFALNLFQQMRLKEKGIWQPCGVLWFLAGNQQREGQKLQGHPWPDTLVRQVDAATASQLAGINIPCPALHFPEAGWLQPAAFCQELLQHPGIQTHYGQAVHDLHRHDGYWQLDMEDGEKREASVVIVANALGARALPPTRHLPLTAVRGQISCMPPGEHSDALRAVICYGGYLSPAHSGQHCLGASFYPGREDSDILPVEHAENRQGLAQYLPELAASLPPTTQWQGRASTRCQTRDYLPLAGPLPDYDDFCHAYAGLRHGNQRLMGMAANQPGLYCLLGFGSKGFTTALLAAELLASELEGAPAPVAREVLDALHPARLWAQQLRQGRR